MNNNTIIEVTDLAIKKAISEENLRIDRLDKLLSGDFIFFNDIVDESAEKTLYAKVKEYCKTGGPTRGFSIVYDDILYAAVDAAFNISHSDALEFERMLTYSHPTEYFVPTYYDGYYNDTTIEMLGKVYDCCPKYYPCIKSWFAAELKRVMYMKRKEKWVE